MIFLKSKLKDQNRYLLKRSYSELKFGTLTKKKEDLQFKGKNRGVSFDASPQSKKNSKIPRSSMLTNT